MFRNYCKIAFRNLMKQKGITFINIFGLTAGLTCFILIALYIVDELTFDAFHTKAGSIYRVVENRTASNGTKSKMATVSYQLSATAAKELPEIAKVCRASRLGRSNVLNDENDKVFLEGYVIANETFFDVFDFPFIAGDRSALNTPNAVVLSEEMAIKIFGHTNVVGKVIRAERDSTPSKITAVVKIPVNSHIKFNVMYSEATVASRPWFKRATDGDWDANWMFTYVLLKNQDPQQTAAKLRQLVAANRKEERAKNSEFYLQPLTDIHFHSADIENGEGSGNLMHIYVFGIVALFVLFIACINYMNLTTARFAGRSKEIAVRKVAGARQKNLIAQFLSEAMIVTLLSLFLALLFVNLFLPYFNGFTEKELNLGIHTDYRIWIGVLLITIVAGVIAGIYPAFFQAKLKPYLLLKQKLNVAKGHLSIRKLLVVVQFALSIIMIVATVIVYQQLKYVDNKDMGFNKEQLLVVDINSGRVRGAAPAIKAEFEKLAAVKSVAITSRVPGEWKDLPKVAVRQAGTREQQEQAMHFISADEQFLSTFEVRLLQGRNFSTGGNADSISVLINATAARLLGITAPSEQMIEIPSVEFTGDLEKFDVPFRARVIGIVNDFNFRSLREPITPMIIGHQPNPIHFIDYFTAKVNAAQVDNTLKQMEAVIQKVDPTHLFEYNFLDKKWELFYREDQKRQIIFFSVALMTILIACLGLFGLATYAAEQRIKEIGIRKVLGASTTGIVTMLSKDFLKLVAVATAIAIPVAWWAMYKWLQDFAYRVQIQWWVFIIAGALALLIALLTISSQAPPRATSVCLPPNRPP